MKGSLRTRIASCRTDGCETILQNCSSSSCHSPPGLGLASAASKVSATFHCLSSQVNSFAWMEILKTLVVVLKRFDLQRAKSEPTIIREGFFNKAQECNIYLSRRQVEHHVAL